MGGNGAFLDPLRPDGDFATVVVEGRRRKGAPGEMRGGPQLPVVSENGRVWCHRVGEEGELKKLFGEIIRQHVPLGPPVEVGEGSVVVLVAVHVAVAKLEMGQRADDAACKDEKVIVRLLWVQGVGAKDLL